MDGAVEPAPRSEVDSRGGGSAANPFSMTLRLLPICLILVALFSAGCTTARTPAQRIEQDRAAFQSWPAEVQRLVQAGEVAVGFNADQVRMALGNPQDVNTRTTAEGQSEVWIYRDRRPRMGLGFGVSGGSGGTGVGLGVGTSTGGTQAPRLRVIFSQGVVTAVEQARQ
jgi:hypothetical protein